MPEFEVASIKRDQAGNSRPSYTPRRPGEELECILKSFPRGSPIALGTGRGATWASDVVEAARPEPHLVHAPEVKNRIVSAFQTEGGDGAGLPMLLCNGTLRRVLTASRCVRDLRGLMRRRPSVDLPGPNANQFQKSLSSPCGRADGCVSCPDPPESSSDCA
jgi:hypothetical protein